MNDTLRRIRKFRDDRDWLQFHNPKDLAMSVVIEAAELMELFQWQSAEESKRTAVEKREALSDEIADVAIYLLELCDITGIDVEKTVAAKLEKNAVKYPVGGKSPSSIP